MKAPAVVRNGLLWAFAERNAWKVSVFSMAATFVAFFSLRVFFGISDGQLPGLLVRDYVIILAVALIQLLALAEHGAFWWARTGTLCALICFSFSCFGIGQKEPEEQCYEGYWYWFKVAYRPVDLFATVCAACAVHGDAVKDLARGNGDQWDRLKDFLRFFGLVFVATGLVFMCISGKVHPREQTATVPVTVAICGPSFDIKNAPRTSVEMPRLAHVALFRSILFNNELRHLKPLAHHFDVAIDGEYLSKKTGRIELNAGSIIMLIPKSAESMIGKADGSDETSDKSTTNASADDTPKVKPEL